MTLSLCMIVKNEEQVLDRCLNSFNGLFDEIIIVDTGSTDKTMEIARKHTTKVFEYPWINDFSAARNYSFSLATSDFIMWLATSEEQLTDYDNEQYPQFMTYDYDNAKLMPLTEESVAPTTADIIFNVLEKITVVIFKIVNDIFASIIK